MLQARELIKQQRYDDARAILRQIDHPTAAQWLARLDEIAPAAPPPPTPQEQLKATRDLILQKRFAEARALLERLDHPMAADWLAKLDQIAPAPAPAVPPPPTGAHDDLLRQAQDLVLRDQHDQARAILEPLDTPEAAFWLDKTAVNQFRSTENVWLDLFRYEAELPPGADSAAWRCAVCGRSLDQTPMCPQRGQPPCPAQARERALTDPRRLALVLQAVSLNQTRGINNLIGKIDAARLDEWRGALEWQLARLGRVDVRRPAIEAAIPLLRALAEKRT